MTNRRRILPIVACLVLGAVRAPGQPRAAAPPDEDGRPAVLAHGLARFRGQPGTSAPFGDSTTVSPAFWSPPVAREPAVPLVDHHAEIREWRPNDRDGLGEAFRKSEGD